METTFIEENRPKQSPEDIKSKLFKVNPVLSFFLNRRNQLTIFIWIFALSVPILCYYFLFHKQVPHNEEFFQTCSVQTGFRIPCGNLNLTKSDARDNCLALSCCFDDKAVECYHSLPSSYFYNSKNEASLNNTPLSTPMDPRMHLTFDDYADNWLKVTLSENSGNKPLPTSSKYTVERHTDRMEIEIKRLSSNKTLLTTGLGPLISSENYLEWTFYLGEHLFGLDQLYMDGNETISKIIYHNGNDHTTLPVFMGYQDGEFHSLLIKYGGLMEFTILPSRLIVLKAIGHREISFTFHIGPTPKDITQFYYKEYGYEPPEMWMLQPHICRAGNDTLYEAIEKYQIFNHSNEIKYASDCFHENLYFMLHSANESSISSLEDVLNELTDNSKFIMSVFPHIPKESKFYDKNSKFFYNMSNSTEHQNGTYLDLEVVYPNYNQIENSEFSKFLKDLTEMLNLPEIIYSFSNNWASDNSNRTNETLIGYVYTHENITKAISGTLLYNSTINGVDHIYDHNNYGKYQVEAYNNLQKTGFLSSIFTPNSKTIAQVENMNGTWANLKRTLHIVMSHSIYAHPLISIPVCGSTEHFNLDDQVELCTRWYIMGATMPMFRISSEPPMRDPFSFEANQTRNSMLKALEIREMFSNYYYSLLKENEPIVRPMFYEFYKNTTTFTLDEQYMVGDGLLVTQLFLQDLYLRRVYIPEGEVFYEYFGGEKYGEGWHTLTAVPSDWFMFIRGGKIIPLFMEDSFALAIALVQSKSENKANLIAEGFLYVEEERVSFIATSETLTISNIRAMETSLCLNERTLNISLIVYGHNDVNVSEILIENNLCDFTEDEYTYTYINK